LSVIKIKWTEDIKECETCGPCYAQGAEVYFNNELVLDFTPCAHCYGISDDYTESDVFIGILEHLGHTFKEVGIGTDENT
jgi:hypothetical protein